MCYECAIRTLPVSGPHPVLCTYKLWMCYRYAKNVLYIYIYIYQRAIDMLSECYEYVIVNALWIFYQCAIRTAIAINMLSTRYRCAPNMLSLSLYRTINMCSPATVLSICSRYPLTMLSIYYDDPMHSLPTPCPQAVNVLPWPVTCYWYQVNTLSICYEFAIDKLSIFRLFRFIIILMCYQYAIIMLCPCRRRLSMKEPSQYAPSFLLPVAHIPEPRPRNSHRTQIKS